MALGWDESNSQFQTPLVKLQPPPPSAGAGPKASEREQALALLLEVLVENSAGCPNANVNKLGNTQLDIAITIFSIQRESLFRMQSTQGNR